MRALLAGIAIAAALVLAAARCDRDVYLGVAPGTDDGGDAGDVGDAGAGD